jgi:hypothetical protein
MSNIWYECKVRYRKLDENGVQKVVTEPYLVDALSYTEAESRINEEMTAYVSEEFKITNIRVANYSEIHPFDNSDRWFKTKIALVAYDEESGKERKSNIYILVQANDIKEAFDNSTHAMKNTMGDYTITAITESPIMDVFPFFKGDEDGVVVKARPVVTENIAEESDDIVVNEEEEFAIESDSILENASEIEE